MLHIEQGEPRRCVVKQSGREGKEHLKHAILNLLSKVQGPGGNRLQALPEELVQRRKHRWLPQLQMEQYLHK